MSDEFLITCLFFVVLCLALYFVLMFIQKLRRRAGKQKTKYNNPNKAGKGPSRHKIGRKPGDRR